MIEISKRKLKMFDEFETDTPILKSESRPYICACPYFNDEVQCINDICENEYCEKDQKNNQHTITITPEMCECGRLYKNRRDKNGKTLCSACYTGLSVDDLKKLWGTPNEIKANNATLD